MSDIKFRYAFKTIDQKIIFQCFTLEELECGALQEIHLAPAIIVAKDRFSSQTDMEGQDIYENDILAIEDDSGKRIMVVCRFGIARRIMESGIEVDIPSFYLEKSDGFKSFPIVNNWNDKHDLEMIKVVSTFHEYTNWNNENR